MICQIAICVNLTSYKLNHLIYEVYEFLSGFTLYSSNKLKMENDMFQEECFQKQSEEKSHSKHGKIWMLTLTTSTSSNSDFDVDVDNDDDVFSELTCKELIYS